MESLIHGVEGFMYPNEIELQWSILIVLYPYITGLVAGAFILASLERVFNVAAVRPTITISRTYGCEGYYALRPMLPEVAGEGCPEPVIHAEYSSADNLMATADVAGYLAERVPEVANASYLSA
jgi:hypothetical protein